MTVCGVEITEMQKTWILAITCQVELRLGRRVAGNELDQVLILAVKHLAEQIEPPTWLQ